MPKTKLRTYAILTTDSMRIEVKAYNVEDAYRKADKKLKEFIGKGKAFGVSKSSKLTSAYETFGREGISYKGWGVSPTSQKMAKRYGGTYGLQKVVNLGW